MARIVLAALVLAVGAFAQTPTGALTGTVTDVNSGVIARAKIAVASLPSRTEATNEWGAFHIAGLEPGEYQLTITSPGFLPKQVSGRVEADQNTALGKIEMKVAPVPGCTPPIQPTPTVVIRKRKHRQHGILIAGTVRAWGKSPVADATVKVRSAEEPDSPTVVHTDRNGSFEITGLKPGTYVLSVEARGYDPVRVVQVILRDGFEARIDDIQMLANLLCL